MLTIKNLSKTYENGIQALKDVTLEIPKGMFGLLGPNGAGKTTLMRTTATLQEPDTGTIRMGDLDVLHEKEKVRKILVGAAILVAVCAAIAGTTALRSAQEAGYRAATATYALGESQRLATALAAQQATATYALGESERLADGLAAQRATATQPRRGTGRTVAHHGRGSRRAHRGTRRGQPRATERQHHAGESRRDDRPAPCRPALSSRQPVP